MVLPLEIVSCRCRLQLKDGLVPHIVICLFRIAVASVGIFYIMFYVIFRIALCFGFLTKRTVNVPERHSTSEVGSPKHSPDGHPPILEETEMQHRHRTVSFHDEKKKLDRDHPKVGRNFGDTKPQVA